MALKVTGQAKVFKFEDKGNWCKASLGLSKKQNGEWQNEYYGANFVKDAKDKAQKTGIPDKTKIEIKNGFLSTSKWNDKTYVNVVITDFDFVDGEPQATPQQTAPAFDIDSVDMDSELPF